jgi:LTXXQ motif family protein
LNSAGAKPLTSPRDRIASYRPRTSRQIRTHLPTRSDVVMKHTLLGRLAAAVALSASGFAITAAVAQSDQQPTHAVPQSDQQPSHAELVQRWAEAALDAQLKGMKTSLRLTADQEKLWGSFESVVKDGAKARVLALQKEQGGNLSPMDLNLAKAERLGQSQANLEKMIEAAKPLYASLDDTQKHKFIALGRMLVPERGQFAKEMRHLR